jgi:hypothetical protein
MLSHYRRDPVVDRLLMGGARAHFRVAVKLSASRVIRGPGACRRRLRIARPALGGQVRRAKFGRDYRGVASARTTAS